MEEIVFLHIFKIFKLIKKYFPCQQQGGRTTFELNSAAMPSSVQVKSTTRLSSSIQMTSAALALTWKLIFLII